jgi:hypothetical protein
MANEHDGAVANVAAHLAEIAGMRWDVNTLWVDRCCGTTVSSIVPMTQLAYIEEIIPQVLPNVPVAADPVAENRRDVAMRRDSRRP